MINVEPLCSNIVIIMKSLDPLRAKKTFIRNKLGHTAVNPIRRYSTLEKAVILLASYIALEHVPENIVSMIKHA